MLTWIDITILAIIGLSIFVGILRGFVREALSLISWILAFWVAFKFADDTEHYFVQYLDSHTARLLISFVLLFLVTLIVGVLISNLLSAIITKFGLGGTDKTLGVVFGAARGLVIVVALVLAADYSPVIEQPVWKKSWLVSYFQPAALWLQERLPKLHFDELR